MRRFGQIITIKPEAFVEYEHLHEVVWPEVLATIHRCNIRNYSIFRHETWLFAYFEYVGDDFIADMKRMSEDPKTQEWWSRTDILQEPLPTHAPGEWWITMREIFHTQ